MSDRHKLFTSALVTLHCACIGASASLFSCGMIGAGMASFAASLNFMFAMMNAVMLARN